MIEPELALLQMEVERRAAHAAELDEPSLSHAPEAFYPVDAGRAAGELVAVVAHPVVLLVAHVDDTVVGLQPVGVGHRRQLDAATNNRLETGFFAVRHDLGVDAPVPLVDAEDDGLAPRPAPALAADTPRAEVALVEFDIPAERRLALAVQRDGLADESQVSVDRVAVQPAQRRDRHRPLGGRLPARDRTLQADRGHQERAGRRAAPKQPR